MMLLASSLLVASYFANPAGVHSAIPHRTSAVSAQATRGTATSFHTAPARGPHGADADALRQRLAQLTAVMRQKEWAKDAAAVLSEMTIIDLKGYLRATERAKAAESAAAVVASMEVIDLQHERTRLRDEAAGLRAELRESERARSAEAARAVIAEMELIDLRAENDRLVTAVRYSTAEFQRLSFAHSLSLMLAHARTAARAAVADATFELKRMRGRYRDVLKSVSLRMLILKVRLGVAVSNWLSARAAARKQSAA
jgi:hypothetical protein